MLLRPRSVLVASIGLAGLAFGAVAPEPLGEAQVRWWIRHLVPLPKQIELTGRLTVPPSQLSIVLPPGSPRLVKQAADELAEAAGISAPSAAPGRFALKLQVDAGNAKLKRLPDPDQAYMILPDDGGDGLLLIGGGPRGLYYAAKTLQQFLQAAKSDDGLRIPRVTITDWPDLQDRGFWGGDSYHHLRWMSDRKLNYDEQISRNGVDAEKQCFVRLNGSKQRIIDEGPAYGINPVPVVLHLEQLTGTGIFEAYPDLKGENGHPGAICYSNPAFVDLLSQWLLLWRNKPGVREVDVWMAENLGGKKGCQCERCRTEDRSVLEARAIVAAARKARRSRPDLGVRILTSEETEKSNPKVFAELPRDMKIWYYHSLFTYNTSRRPIIRPYLVQTVERGRWLGVCCNLCANVGCWQPFTGAAFIRGRMSEFVDKGLSGFLGYAVPGIPLVDFNAEAAAEWSWNARGRSTREFAISYAVRQGYARPEEFAEWSETLGPVGWDIYGSEFPAGEKRKFPGKLAELLASGKLPELGEVLWDVYPMPWGDIRSAAQLDRDVQQAERAVRLAHELGIPQYLHESLVIQGYAKTLKALWQLEPLVKDGTVADSDRPAARRLLRMYVGGLEQARAALPAWEKSLPSAGGREHRVKETVSLLSSMIAEMKALAGRLGCSLE